MNESASQIPDDSFQQPIDKRIKQAYQKVGRAVLSVEEEKKKSDAKTSIGLYLIKIKNYLVELANALRIIWPSVVFVSLGIVAFILVPQGRDLIIMTHEPGQHIYIYAIAVIFWSMLAWFSGRVIAHQHYPDKKLPPVLINLTRLFGAGPFAAICMAILSSDVYPATTFEWIMICVPSILVYVVLLIMVRGGMIRSKEADEAKKWQFTPLHYLGACVIFVGVAYLIEEQPLLFKMSYMLWGSFAFGILFMLLTSFKAELPASDQLGPSSRTLRWIKIHINKYDVALVKKLGAAFAIGFIIYTASILWLDFARLGGAIAIVMLSLAVLNGIFNFISSLSKKYQVSVLLIIFVWALIAGQIWDPYAVRTVDNADRTFGKRLELHQYFDVWWENHRENIRKTNGDYPVYLVMSNGGASRSGYWVVSVLGELMDHSGEDFSKHLLCISGASGGSVGNATFFAMLNERQKSGLSGFRDAGCQFLQNDFLSQTLGRMLGSDILNHVLPTPIDDRAASLEESMEYPEKDTLVCKWFRRHMTWLVTDTVGGQESWSSRYKLDKNKLPIFFINSTRSQDGRPAVISNIKIDPKTYNNRIDLLAELDRIKEKPPQDIRLSTAAVLSARFPYVSPAGEINGGQYVDGGYFDNSGAGVVHETLDAFEKYIANRIANDDIEEALVNKLDFHVIHITNSETGKKAVEPFHPVTNDLAAPIITILGSYGQQTITNDTRLKAYLAQKYGDTKHYHRINLFTEQNELLNNVEQSGEYIYSMNWVMSDTCRSAMNIRLDNCREFAYLRDSVIKRNR